MKNNKIQFIVVLLALLSILFGIYRFNGGSEEVETKKIIELVSKKIENREGFNNKELKVINKYFDSEREDEKIKMIDNVLAEIYVSYLIERLTLNQEEIIKFVSTLNQQYSLLE